MNICFYTDFRMSGMTGGIGRVTTVLTDYFRQIFGWKVYSIYAFEPKKDCLLAQHDGDVRLRLHDRMGIRHSLKANYPLAANFIKEKSIEAVIIQTSMDVVAKLRLALDAIGLNHVKIISVLHYTPGTDEFPINATRFWQEIKRGKFSIKDFAKSIIAPLYNQWQHWATVQAYKKSYLYGDRVVVLSESYVKLFKKYASLEDTEKLIAIPNCIPFEFTMTEKDIQQKQKTCLLVGRMVDFPKRVSLVLKMWKQIEQRQEAQNWNLEIIGDGPDLEAFRNNAQTLGLQRCSFAGRQNPIEYYRKASLFFMTSEFEGFPMTLVEAQQMGCVPIAFDSFESLHEVIEDGINGRIIPEGDVEKYIETSLLLMNNSSNRQQLAEHAIIDCKRYKQESICNLWKSLLS